MLRDDRPSHRFCSSLAYAGVEQYIFIDGEPCYMHADEISVPRNTKEIQKAQKLSLGQKSSGTKVGVLGNVIYHLCNTHNEYVQNNSNGIYVGLIPVVPLKCRIL